MALDLTFRAFVDKKLLPLIQEECGRHLQTTHGSLFADGTLESVAEQLKDTILRPGSHAISELEQRIDAYLKRHA